MTKNQKNICLKVKSIPSSSGVYQFFDINGKIIYIGKAKNLKKRILSYFSKNHDVLRLKMLVKKIADIKYIVVKSEQDAFLLENSLIKQYKPKYNIQLKDDKTYPWICLKNERFPRIFSTRNRIEDQSLYFGPYTSSYMVKTLLNLIKSLYPLRSCNLLLTNENILKKKFKTCLEYQIENCKGPCEGKQNESDYNESIENIKKILKGNLLEVITFLKNLMLEKAKNYNFEEAEIIKKKINILEKFQAKSTIVSTSIHDLDVFSITSDQKIGVINYLKIVHGAIVQSHTLEIQKKLDEPDEELLYFGITDIYQKIESSANEVIIPLNLSLDFFNKKGFVPKIGDKKKLLDLSLRNAWQYKIAKEKTNQENKKESSEIRKMLTMQKDLRLMKIPEYIECFDNSNIQGTNPVSSCVVFKNTKPSKKEYRHFTIKTVIGPDDYASMREVIKRRYIRLLEEEEPLPDLIIIDGGKGQLQAAFQVLKSLDLHNQIAIIGIAKRLEEIFYPNDQVPLYLDKNSETLKVIQQARNEAHRFGISFHRSKRSKEMIISELDQIKGIGEKTKTLLLNHFKTVQEIKLQEITTLKNLIGHAKAVIVKDFFRD